MLVEQYGPLHGNMFQIMDENGIILRPDLVPELSDQEWLELYKVMVKTRCADDNALKLQRQGRMLTYAPNTGQEAAQVGSAAAMAEKDWLVPAFRELGAWLLRGVDLEKVYLYWYGNEFGSQFPEHVRVLPIAVPIASQLQHAVGIAMASNIKGEKDVTVAYVGDGGTSTGDFNEALNFAGVFNAPVVFIIQNNQYAISVARQKQTRAETLVQKAVAAGIPGILADGNDLMAMYAATKEAVERARSGGGPTLIEAYTYRLGAHTTSDDPTKYRQDEEVEQWQVKDPIRRMKAYLTKRGVWSEGDDLSLIEQYSQEALEVFRKVEASGETRLEDIFHYHFQETPAHLTEQYEEYVQYLKEVE
ncbi:MAG: pyruvate dehydrogenase (acetyl-transferring) E1 component subunit alpha [Bacillota bacterium]|jgi:pyruvate dehydrogenase E1 component alpha subunit|nr:pyruvate dehydrogenase (acetyl-transferring) E1 component subunit alpha [Bacillota bacterium]NLJ03397.1 pyruvate dehydrogenase (acetyl-transferring) E1 component subunit alpha [Bacillota bacterium]